MESVVKEMDTFPTSYQKSFKWFKGVVRPLPFNKNKDPYEMSAEERKRFLFEKLETISPTELLVIKNLISQRMMTTYKVSYCKARTESFEQEMEDALMIAAAELFSVPNKTLLPPTTTSRRVLAYCRPTNYYTQISEYQDKYSRLGYDVLYKANQGGSRIGPKMDIQFCKELCNK